MRARVAKLAVLAAVLVLSAAAAAWAQGKDVPKSLVKFATDTLVGFGEDAQLVAAVEKDNLKPAAVDKLKELDRKWKAKEGVEDLVSSLLSNPTAARLKTLIGSHQYLPEAFIMNAQGTIIGETNRTSTYWKGEQEKFTAAYNGGQGAIWYGKLEYDESTKTNAIQISVPVKKAGKTIGAICFTVNVDEWEKR
jgi:hypothetical protein